MKGASSFLAVLFIFIALIMETVAIKCFQCNSAYDPECIGLNTTRSNKFIVDCDKISHKSFMNLKASFCGKLYQKGDEIFKLKFYLVRVGRF